MPRSVEGGDGKLVEITSRKFTYCVAALVIGQVSLTTVSVAQQAGDRDASESWRTEPLQPPPEPVVVIPGDTPAPPGQIRALGAGFPPAPPAPYAAAGAPPPAEDRRDLSGIWLTTQFVIPPMTTIHGEPLPYSVEGQNLLWHRQNMATTGYSVISSTYVCRPPGILNSLNYGSPIELVQSDGMLAVMGEEGRGLFTVRIDEPHQENALPSFNGDAVAHWEGQTLVIDIVGLNGEVNADWAGSPLSAAAHVVIRLTRIDRGGPFEDMQALISVDDPTYYTAPWTMLKTYRWRPDMHLDEFDCEKGDQPANTEGLRLENPALIRGNGQ